jgi:hypothetical protein
VGATGGGQYAGAGGAAYDDPKHPWLQQQPAPEASPSATHKLKTATLIQQPFIAEKLTEAEKMV